MSEQIVPINWPFLGLSETLAFSTQEPGTARDYQNVRGIDPKTGRLRGGQRSGLSKYMPDALKASGTKAQDLTAFFQNNRQVEYTAIASGSETTTWSTATPSKMDCRNVKVDRQGNVYATDGNAGLLKYSSDGRKLWRIAVPVTDTNHVIRALAVDDTDIIYVGVSSGGLQEKAKLWAYEQLSDNKTEILWELTPGAYIEDLFLAHSKLYTCQNRPDTKTALVRIYEFQNTTRVKLAKDWQVPFPVNSIAVKADASVLVACEATENEQLLDGDPLYWRAPDPRFPAFSVASEDWTPRNLNDYDKRVWAWYVADDIDETDVGNDFVDGVEVVRWRDRTKNGRHWIAPKDEGDGGPKLAFNAMPGARKGIRFSTRGITSPLQSLKTLDNGSITESFKQNQRTALPGYSDSAFATFIVCRPSDTNPIGDSIPRWVFGQDRDSAGSGSDDHILFINASPQLFSLGDSPDDLPPVANPGKVFWYQGQFTDLSGGDGTDGTIRLGSFVDLPPSGTAVRDNPGHFVIIAMVDDGDALSGKFSLFEINGHPIDRFTDGPSFTIYRTQMGIYRPTGAGGGLNPSSGVSGFLGDIFEIISIDKQTDILGAESILTSDELENGSPAQSQTINEMTAIVGYLAHRYGAQLNLPYGTATTNNFPHPYGVTGTTPDILSGPPGQSTLVSSAQALANKSFACVVKYNSEGKIQWTANEMATGDGSRPGGFGYAVAVNSDGNIYSLGPNPTIAGGAQQVRMIIDQGTTFSISSGDGAWSATFPSSAEQDYHYPRVAVDAFDNLYIPYNDTAEAASFQVYKKDGTLLHSKALTSPQKGMAVAISETVPDYRMDIDPKRAEHVIVAGDATTDGDDTIVKVRLVSAAQTGDAPRTLVTVGVSGGDIVSFSTGGTSAITNGTGALDASAYVQSTALFKKVYWTDGRQYKQYSVVTNEVTSYVSTSAGEVPQRCSLIEAWRGRIVLARSADEPHSWFLSKKDNPDDWDFFPPTPTETDAVAGSNSPAGLCPDIINTLVPYSEDVLVFGGDHSIWALIGDPAAGGRLEMVSDITGMSFGRPWAKDPHGVLYFFGSQGGLYRWKFGTAPERISLSRIERQLQDVNLATHYIRLVYNHRDEGVHIFQCPFGAGGTVVAHWFYEIKTNSFAKDVFGTSAFTNVQPTAVIAIDGDEVDDRTMLIGGEDGFVRKWDMDAKSDDTRTDGNTPLAIDSFVTLFPLPGLEQASAMETQFSGLTVVLAEDQAGCRYELFSSETPELLGQPRRQGELHQGRNPPKWDRVVGPYCGIRLRNGAREQRWSFERAYIRASAAGLARPRS